MNPGLLFVYGTLRAGQAAHHKLAGCKFVGTAATRGHLSHVGLYPVLNPGSGWVAGELYQLPDGRDGEGLLSELDEYEAVSEVSYTRSWVRAAGHTAWAYLAPPDEAKTQPYS